MIEKLQKALRIDKDLFEVYKANIAVEFQDAVYNFRKRNKSKSYLSKMDIHIISNQAAENFLKRLSKK